MREIVPQMPQPCHRGEMLCFQGFVTMCGMCGTISVHYCALRDVYAGDCFAHCIKTMAIVPHMVTRRCFCSVFLLWHGCGIVTIEHK